MSTSISVAQRPDTFTFLSFGGWLTLDPARAYDAASLHVLTNVYETLFTFRHAATRGVQPLLAQTVPTLENGLIRDDGLRYRIPIREGVRFHSGDLLTADDVAYSLRRFLITNAPDGPTHTLLDPLFGTPTLDDEALAFADVAEAIRAEDNALLLTLHKRCAPFLAVLAAWSYTLNQQWATALGEWPGTAESLQNYTARARASTALDRTANGTGPFQFVRWDADGRTVVLERFEGYWRGPARLRIVEICYVEDIENRLRKLEAGEVDYAVAARKFEPALRAMPGVTVVDGLPELNINPAICFTFVIDGADNPAIGSGRLDGQGIPPNFFQDQHVRRAFAYAFDYQRFIDEAFGGKALPPQGPFPPGLQGYRSDRPYYRHDLARAAEELKQAWGGAAWEHGFRFTMYTLEGNAMRARGCQILKEGLKQLHPRIHIETQPLAWPAFNRTIRAHRAPIFWAAAYADYPDAHTFAFDFLHSGGSIARAQRFHNPILDSLVDEAVAELDPTRRTALYERIADLAVEELPQIYTAHRIGFAPLRTWVRGYKFDPHTPGLFYYHDLWKEVEGT